MAQSLLTLKGRTSTLLHKFKETDDPKTHSRIFEEADEIVEELYPLINDLAALHCFDVDTTSVPNSPGLFLVRVERDHMSIKLILAEEKDSNSNEQKAALAPASEA
jgi:hypothetical protein